jgi:hypothetical protein
MLVHTCIPRTQKNDTGGSQVPGHPEPYKWKLVSKKMKREQDNMQRNSCSGLYLQKNKCENQWVVVNLPVLCSWSWWQYLHHKYYICYKLGLLFFLQKSEITSIPCMIMCNQWLGRLRSKIDNAKCSLSC